MSKGHFGSNGLVSFGAFHVKLFDDGMLLIWVENFDYVILIFGVDHELTMLLGKAPKEFT